MPPARAAACAALLTAVVLVVAGCADVDRSGDTRAGSPSAAGQTSPHPSGTPGRTDASPHGEHMKIPITVGDQRLQATIFDSEAGRDLITQLPLTIDMADHGSVEKTGPLPSPLSRDGQPDGADPTSAMSGTTHPATISSSTTATSRTTPAS